MRNIININSNWQFSKDKVNFEDISLPHTWNAIDGQDGENDYYRGKCYYKKEFSVIKNDTDVVYLEFNGVNQSCDVIFNGKKVFHHAGGYSTFRVDVTDLLKKENILEVEVSNKRCDNVYPQQADFTFFGGIYRDVNVIVVSKTHFALGYYGGKGIKVTPELNENVANVKVEAFIENGENEEVKFIIDGVEKISKAVDGKAIVNFEINNPHLWNGIKDPYLYKLVSIVGKDEVSTSFGIRTFKMDPQNGFILNGKKYLLRGVARHQDRLNKGYAISKEDHEEDIKIIMEMGATSIRLAHYQHDQYFYDLCDTYGIVAWAEIPYISEHLPNARENTITQMKELVIQNYNHPSIVCWGLSNEICLSNDDNQDRLENHIILNDLCHKEDKTRPTVMAHIGAFSFDINKLFDVPDIHGCNLYYGWYEKKVEDAKEYFDSRHIAHPTKAIAISEYGADCNPIYCSNNPERGDYSEAYQCFYHENMLKIIEERPYLWASYVWNMFDFGADGRSEGGKPGQNQKGLVTYDRKYKKDAYYLYKAHWNEEPMIHICNKNYVDRVEEETKIVVYSNLDTISLFVDDKLIETKTGKYKFEFNIHISKEHMIKVISGELMDTCVIKKVDTPNPKYHLDNRAIINWLGFIDKERDGYFTLNSTVKEIFANEEATNYVLPFLESHGITRQILEGENPRAPGQSMVHIPIKFVLRMVRGLDAKSFNDFAEGLMKIKS